MLGPALLTLYIDAADMGSMECLLVLIAISLAVVISYQSLPGPGLKFALACLSVLALIPSVSTMMLTCIFDEVAQTSHLSYIAPSGAYIMDLSVYEYSEGSGVASFASAAVYAAGGRINLFFGILSPETVARYAMDRIDPDQLTVVWRDEDVIDIDGDQWHWQSEPYKENRDVD